jgi:Zn ribbon nucleic-acid-binding protein
VEKMVEEFIEDKYTTEECPKCKRPTRHHWWIFDNSQYVACDICGRARKVVLSPDKGESDERKKTDDA